MRVMWRKVKYPRIDLREGEILIIAPPGTDIDALLKQKRVWIEEKTRLIEKLKERAEEEIKRYGIRILDKYVEVRHSCTKTGVLNHRVYICKKRSGYLREQLRNMLRRDLQRKIERYAEVLGVHPHRVYIREQKTKWGSCSSSKNLSFNLLLIFLPADFREYVVAHEMVHLIYPSHGTGFKEKLNSLGIRIPGREETLYNWYYAGMCKKKLLL